MMQTPLLGLPFGSLDDGMTTPHHAMLEFRYSLHPPGTLHATGAGGSVDGHSRGPSYASRHVTSHPLLSMKEEVVPTRRPVLVIINPFGGTGAAVALYESRIAPIFLLAGVPTEVFLTEYGGHAMQHVQQLDVTQYSAITSVSGDGVFHEIVNGLLQRPDWETASLTPICVIGAGSANAMSRNLMTPSPESAAVAIVQGQTRRMDAFSIVQNGKLFCYSHLQLMWAFMADLDIESDKYRWLGPARFDVAAVVRAFRLRHYVGNVRYLRADAPLAQDLTHQRPTAPCGKAPSTLREPGIAPPGWRAVAVTAAACDGDLVATVAEPPHPDAGRVCDAHERPGLADLQRVRARRVAHDRRHAVCDAAVHEFGVDLEGLSGERRRVPRLRDDGPHLVPPHRADAAALASHSPGQRLLSDRCGRPP
ncbi:hypothetical protein CAUPRSCDRAFT_12279 [Caulochytrium protostelioides]|uniref:DAGKc domain-containing protein n=1 Tax=Caulochytrium protostelioides TaxID=1555241 RepID=A0A4P9WS41_9FUNG|nr:hypothetical protein CAUPRSCDRAFT_12279 [Caulochytrium protostelioides]